MKVKSAIVKMPEYEFSFELTHEELKSFCSAIKTTMKMLPDDTLPYWHIAVNMIEVMRSTMINPQQRTAYYTDEDQE